MSQSWAKSTEALVLGLVAILGLFCRGVYAFFLGDILAINDAASYWNDAQSLATGAEYVPFFPPGLPLYLALWIKCFGTTPLVALAAMLSLFAVLIWQIWTHFASKMRFSAQVGIGLFLFASPELIHFSLSTQTQLPTALLLILGLRETLRPHMKLHHLCLLGLWMGLLVLVRPSNALVAGLLLLVAASKQIRRASLLAALGICVTIIGTWEIYAHKMTQRWIPINEATAMNLWFGNHEDTPLYATWWFGSHGIPEGTRAASEFRQIRATPLAHQGKSYQKALLQEIGKRPDLFLLRTINRIACFFAFDTFVGASIWQDAKAHTWATFFLIVDAILYVWLIWDTLRLRSFWLQKGYFWIILAFALPYFFSFSHPSYHFPLLAVVCLINGQAKTANSKSDVRFWQFKTLLIVFLGIQVQWGIVNYWLLIGR